MFHVSVRSHEWHLPVPSEYVRTMPVLLLTHPLIVVGAGVLA